MIVAVSRLELGWQRLLRCGVLLIMGLLYVLKRDLLRSLSPRVLMSPDT